MWPAETSGSESSGAALAQGIQTNEGDRSAEELPPTSQVVPKNKMPGAAQLLRQCNCAAPRTLAVRHQLGGRSHIAPDALRLRILMSVQKQQAKKDQSG